IIDITLVIIGLIGLILATLNDIKYKEVPDFLSYSLITIGLSLRLIYSLTYKQYSYFIYALIYGLIFFGIGSLLYYTKQWGGGDTKLLTALSILFATKPYFILQIKLPFFIILLINILLTGFIYSLIWSIILAIKNRYKFIEQYHLLSQKYKKFKIIALILALFVLMLMFLVNNNNLKLIIIALSFAIIFYIYLFIFLKSVEKVSMFKLIPISKLTEGDWIASSEIKSQFKIPKTGIEKQQINLIKKSKLKRILIKDGIPFVPPFLIGTIITLLSGKILFLF
ncbi:MAG: A24 family peptidase, partial [Candidatus Woesearchaeota archaeon]|nr:A24 family peptidase [Candidatus Woesearchaeota archaeon]